MRLLNTMKCVSGKSRKIPLMCLPQGCKDVEENLGDLVLWLNKLKDRMATTCYDENRQETERHEQLTRLPSHPYRHTDSC